MRLKTISLIVVLTLCLSLFAGCAGTKTESTAPAADTSAQVSAAPSEAAPAQSEAAPTGEPTLDSMWPLSTDGAKFTLFNTRADNEFLDNTSDSKGVQYIQQLTGVTIEYMDYNGRAGSEKFNLLVASGDYCDLYLRLEQYYNSSLSAAIDDGVIMDLAPILDKMPNLKNYIETNTEAKKRFYTDDGKAPMTICIYQQPTQGKTGLIVRKDWLDKCGLKAPDTYDDMYNMLTAFKTELGADSAYILNQEGIPRIDSLSAGYGISGVLTVDPQVAYPFYIDDGKVKYGQTQEGFKKLVTMLNKWYSEGLIYKDFYSMTGWDVDTSLLYNNEAGMWIGDGQIIDTYNANGPSATSSPDYSVIGIANPLVAVGDTNYLNYAASTTDSGPAISPQCENIDLLLQYLDNTYTEAMAKAYSYGVEGETFNYDADGVPHFTDVITKNPEGLTFNEAKQLYVGGSLGCGLDVGTSINNQYTTQVTLDAQTAWSRSGGKYDPYPTLVSLTAEESERFTGIMNDIATYSLEHMIKLIMGEDPISYIDTYISTIESMGINEAIEIRQTAYDRYLAR